MGFSLAAFYHTVGSIKSMTQNPKISAGLWMVRHRLNCGFRVNRIMAIKYKTRSTDKTAARCCRRFTQTLTICRHPFVCIQCTRSCNIAFTSKENALSRKLYDRPTSK